VTPPWCETLFGARRCGLGAGSLPLLPATSSSGEPSLRPARPGPAADDADESVPQPSEKSIFLSTSKKLSGNDSFWLDSPP